MAKRRPHYVNDPDRCERYGKQLAVLISRGLFDQARKSLDSIESDLSKDTKSDAVGDLFGPRIGNILNDRFGCQYLHEVQKLSRNELLAVPGVSGETVRQVVAVLDENKMSLRIGDVD